MLDSLFDYIFVNFHLALVLEKLASLDNGLNDIDQTTITDLVLF